MTVPFKKNRFANRGKKAEDAVQKFLTEWAQQTNREFSRLVDTKAAGRTIKAAPADFEFFTLPHENAKPVFGLLEVKETEHEYRLARDKVPQLARLRKRENCGGLCLVLVLHSTLGKWRVVRARKLATFGDKGSWDLTNFPLFDSPREALANFDVEVFE
jgi:hypothetical protein